MRAETIELTSEQVLGRLKEAIERREPFSLIRIGDGENRFLTQDSIWTMEETMKDAWAVKANKRKEEKGVTFPNLALRDRMVEAIKIADVVGLLRYGDQTIIAPDHLKRPLTDQLFRHFNLHPKFTCDALVCRALIQLPEFWRLLQGLRIVVVTRDARQVKKVLQANPYQLNVVGTIAFNHYEQMDDALQKFEQRKDDFDIALFACGVNAVALAPKVAELTGKIALDMGKALTRFLPGHNKG